MALQAKIKECKDTVCGTLSTIQPVLPIDYSLRYYPNVGPFLPRRT